MGHEEDLLLSRGPKDRLKAGPDVEHGEPLEVCVDVASFALAVTSQLQHPAIEPVVGEESGQPRADLPVREGAMRQ